MGTKITDRYFEYEGKKYFRENAHNVELCAYGEKKDPIGATAYLDVQNRVAADRLAERPLQTTTVSVDWNQASKAEVEANGFLKFFGLGATVAVKGSYDKAKSAKLKLLNIAIDETPLRAMLNNDANAARNFLAKEGADGRIVSEVWVVVEGELAEHFSTSGKISASADAGAKGLNVTASGGKLGSQTITLEKDATFAYKLTKAKDWNNDKTRIEDLEADWKGMS